MNSLATKNGCFVSFTSVTTSLKDNNDNAVLQEMSTNVTRYLLIFNYF